MKAMELMKRYSMEEHIENGSFIERHFESREEGRPSSGSIYYYVAPGEKTGFHRIDCDEYWVHVEGSTLDLCIIYADGEVCIRHLGTEEETEPFIYFPKGCIFASRNRHMDDGAFVTCITVPRFTYEGFELFEDDAILEKYPETADFMK